ncbi:MAG: hypothetical protein ABGX63_05785 [bacterium]
MVQGVPLAISIVTIVIGGTVTATLMSSTVADTVKRVQAHNIRQERTDGRVRTLESGQAVINERLRFIQAEQKRLGQEVKDGQQIILREIRNSQRSQ